MYKKESKDKTVEYEETKSVGDSQRFDSSRLNTAGDDTIGDEEDLGAE